MHFDKRQVQQKLSRLNWAGGLTREQMMLALGAAEQKLDEELYYHLPAGKKFHSADEVITALPEVVWTGSGDLYHEPQEVFGPKVAPESAARGKTGLQAQKERKGFNHDDEKSH